MTPIEKYLRIAPAHLVSTFGAEYVRGTTELAKNSKHAQASINFLRSLWRNRVSISIIDKIRTNSETLKSSLNVYSLFEQ